MVFHITLADPELYTNGIYTNNFTIESGTYFFRFVPNGSSPEILSIKLSGQNYSFIENFNLKGIPMNQKLQNILHGNMKVKKTSRLIQCKKLQL